MSSLELALTVALNNQCHLIADRVRQKWAGVSVDGQREIDVDLPMVIHGMVTARLAASGMGAWIMEFGEGSLMDSSNPWLAEYKRSSQWNPARDSLAITGRPHGGYTDLDNNQQFSSGHNQGRSVEYVHPPLEPMHIIENEIVMAMSEIQESLIEAMTNFVYSEVG